MYPLNASAGVPDGLASHDTRRTLLYMSWHDEARRLVDAQGVTYRELRYIFDAKTKGTVGHHLRGRNETTVEQFFALAKHLGVTGQELWDAGEAPSFPTDPVSCCGLASLPPSDRNHLQSVIRKLVSCATWDGKVERRKSANQVSFIAK